ncbi:MULTISPECIES: hypothetical protein [Staphylococcus]|uniref:hypothetical protein n=1 Tax=Staphylococcus TaxID=1279 RepID=UPI0018E40FF0|nr:MULTISPECIES: hypothetical protein [Staphylococcus]MBI5973315.1 hypothetical protein [Staphylococcus caledonicus]MCI2947900.1 hypothetical protein [Staphylococcus sp. acrmy]
MSNQFIDYQQHLIHFITLIEKIKYYYFMDESSLLQAIEHYNEEVKNYALNPVLNEEIYSIAPSQLSSTSPNHLYYKLLIELSEQPLHNFQQGTLLCDLNKRQQRIYHTYLKIKELQNDL